MLTQTLATVGAGKFFVLVFFYCTLIEGQKLYLIVKKVDGVWRILPWTSTNDAYPPLGEVMSTDKQTVGGVIYVGKSTDQNRSVQTSNKHTTSINVCESLVARGIMNQLEVNLGI